MRFKILCLLEHCTSKVFDEISSMFLLPRDVLTWIRFFDLLFCPFWVFHIYLRGLYWNTMFRLSYQNCFPGRFIEVFCHPIRRLSQLLLQRSDRQLGPELGRRVARTSGLRSGSEDGPLLGQDLAAGKQSHVEVVDVGNQQVRVVVFNLKKSLKFELSSFIH